LIGTGNGQHETLEFDAGKARARSDNSWPLQDAARALADAEQQKIAVRKNMARLRALREASELEQARAQASRSAGFNERPKKRFSR